MAWENFNLVFPENRTGTGEAISLDEILKYDYIKIPRYHFARDMITQKDLLVWSADGDYSQIIEYDVNGYNNKPEKDSCLSVYGNKMVLDYYERNQYIERRKSGEAQRAGFNYTGL